MELDQIEQAFRGLAEAEVSFFIFPRSEVAPVVYDYAPTSATTWPGCGPPRAGAPTTPTRGGR